MSDTEDPTQTKLKLVELLSARMTGSVWKIDAYIMLVMAIPKFSIPIALPPGKVDRRLGRNREKEKKKKKKKAEKERRTQNKKKGRGSTSPGTAWAEKRKALALRVSRLASIFGAVCPYIRHKQRKIFLYKKLLGFYSKCFVRG